MIAADKVDHVAAALRAIIERDYGPCWRDETGPLPVLTGQEPVGEDEVGKDGVITVSEDGIVLWWLVENNWGSDPVSRGRLDGLGQFMKVVMWPRLAREWDEHRLMTENAWSDDERAAIDAWEFGKATLRRLIYRDHLERMRSYPELAALYVAVHSRDAGALLRYTAELPGLVAQVGYEHETLEHIHKLGRAIEENDRELVLSQSSFLVFRAISIAVMENGDFDLYSDEQADCNREVSAQRFAVAALAQRRYAAQFLAFCLSPEMLAIREQYFSGMPEGDEAAYRAVLSAFVGGRLETIGQNAFYR